MLAPRPPQQAPSRNEEGVHVSGIIRAPLKSRRRPKPGKGTCMQVWNARGQGSMRRVVGALQPQCGVSVQSPVPLQPAPQIQLRTNPYTPWFLPSLKARRSYRVADTSRPRAAYLDILANNSLTAVFHYIPTCSLSNFPRQRRCDVRACDHMITCMPSKVARLGRFAHCLLEIQAQNSRGDF
jgi:hypothetical protein